MEGLPASQSTAFRVGAGLLALGGAAAAAWARVQASSLLAPLGSGWALAATSGEKSSWLWRSSVGCLLAAALVATCLVWTPFPAEAAQSGGRVGGSSFSSSRSRSAAPRSSSSSSSSSRGYSAPPLTGSGGTVVFAPSYGMSLMPFGGYYGGYGGGLPFGGLFLVVAAVGFFALNFLQGLPSRLQGPARGPAPVRFGWDDDYEEPRGSVVKLQVGLVGQARGLQKELDQLAAKADTDSPEGLHFVLQEAVLSLLRNPDLCVYGFSEGMQGLELERAEDQFNRESMAERSKIQRETVINYGGVTKTGATTAPAKGAVNELIVVTLLVAVATKLALPPVRDNDSLKEALRKLGGVRVDDLLALELLWTPQEETDTYTLDEFVHDYPRLNRI